MAQKKEPQEAHDKIVTADHILEAQRTMVTVGSARMLARAGRVEPELAAFIAAGAKEIAALAMIDSEMSRQVAQLLRERIEALAVSVFGAHFLAVYDFYKDMVTGTPVAELLPPNRPTSAPVVEGGSDVPAQ